LRNSIGSNNDHDKTYAFANSLGREVQNGAGEAIRSYENGTYIEEPEISSVLCHEVCSHISKKIGDVEVLERTNRSSGPKNEESVTGADIVVNFRMDLPNFQEQKRNTHSSEEEGEYQLS